jgi:hypothetical protein
MVALMMLLVGCADIFKPGPQAREWQDGDRIYYDDGHSYQDSVSIAYPHYHIEGGTYVPTSEPSKVHYHKSLNPKGPPNQYIRCFARHRDDGTWEHRPQWYENDPRRYREQWDWR